ncbi:MAG: stage V sporulation protein S [Chloroflexota bacterium]|nr:stage V sporulation protein S [Chloroflexota bacterium]
MAGLIRQVGQVELQAIGAGAINQAVKATAIARSYLQEERIDLWCIPAFIELVIDGEERTALRLVIEVQR